MNRPIRRYEQIELVIAANSTATKINFPDLPQLRSDVTKDIVIRGIQTFSVLSVPVDYNGVAVATYANLQAASLTLYVNGEESIFRIPLIKLLSQYGDNSAAAYQWTADGPMPFENIMVDWTKSYISAPAAFGNGAAFAFLFGIEYKRLAPGTMLQLQPDTRFDNPRQMM